jgi:hypothetical protein
MSGQRISAIRSKLKSNVLPFDVPEIAHRAAKLGYRVHRSRRRKGRDNAGKFMLLHKASSAVLLGAGFTASLEMILEFIEREAKVKAMLADALGKFAKLRGKVDMLSHLLGTDTARKKLWTSGDGI